MPAVACAVLLIGADAVTHASRAQDFETFIPISVPGYDQDRGAVIAQRPRTEFDPIGVHVGAFTVRPRLDETFGYNDNVLGQSSGSGSFFVNTAPQISFNSNYSRNSIGGSVGLSDIHYLSLPLQDETDYNASLGGSFEIGNDTLTAAISHMYQHEDPTAIDSQTLTQPVGYHVTDARLRYDKEIARWQFEPNAEYISYRYDDQTVAGEPLTQKILDRDVYVGGLTTRFAAWPERSLVVVLRGIETRYVADLGGGARPNSTAYEALAGVNYAVSGNLQFLLLVGYEVRQFESSAFSNRSSPVGEASVVWTPSGLTTITGRVSRSIEDAIGETTTGVTYTRGKVTLDHELRRNWLVQFGGGFEHAEFTQGNQTVYSTDASVTYRFNRNLSVGGSYSFSARTGTSGVTQIGVFSDGLLNGTGSNYTQNTFLVHLGLAL